MHTMVNFITNAKTRSRAPATRVAQKSPWRFYLYAPNIKATNINANVL